MLSVCIHLWNTHTYLLHYTSQHALRIPSVLSDKSQHSNGASNNSGALWYGVIDSATGRSWLEYHFLAGTRRWEAWDKLPKCVTQHQVSNLNRITMSMAVRCVPECVSWWHTTRSATFSTSHYASWFILRSFCQGWDNSLCYTTLTVCFG
jgi:hypothetical protein